jgi:hypothetical protein
MRRALLVLLVALAPAAASGKGKRRPAPVTHTAPELPRPQATPAPVESKAPDPPRPAARPPKAKVYNFTGLDVEGKLKTPQLLYFFDRVKLELDTTAQPKRSFIKELEASSSDKGL